MNEFRLPREYYERRGEGERPRLHSGIGGLGEWKEEWKEGWVGWMGEDKRWWRGSFSILGCIRKACWPIIMKATYVRLYVRFFSLLPFHIADIYSKMNVPCYCFKIILTKPLMVSNYYIYLTHMCKNIIKFHTIVA